MHFPIISMKRYLCNCQYRKKHKLTRERVENWIKKTNQFTARCKFHSLGKMEIDAPDKSRLLHRDTVLRLTRHTAPFVSTSETSNSLNSVLQWSCFVFLVQSMLFSLGRARALIGLMSFWLMRLLFNAFLSCAFSQPNLISVHFVRIKLDFYRHLIRLLNITNTKT